MEKIEFMSTAGRPITIFLDKITAVSKFDTTSSIVYSIGNSSGFIIFEKYEDAIRKIEEVEKEREGKDISAINIVFDGPPGPKPSNFVEVELDDGKSINAGEWTRRGKYWILCITSLPKKEKRRKYKDDK